MVGARESTSSVVSRLVKLGDILELIQKADEMPIGAEPWAHALSSPARRGISLAVSERLQPDTDGGCTREPAVELTAAARSLVKACVPQSAGRPQTAQMRCQIATRCTGWLAARPALDGA